MLLEAAAEEFVQESKGFSRLHVAHLDDEVARIIVVVRLMVVAISFLSVC